MSDRPFKTRFAPSPTGLLHLGNIRTALFNALLARKHGGTFLLRLEDTDAMRGHEKFAAALQADLRWLGLPWDEGPEAGGAHGPYAQSERGDIYKEYFTRLEAQSLAYPCFCSEHELAVERKLAIANRRPPRYSGKCRRLPPDEVQARFAKGLPATLRFRVPDACKVGFDDKVRGPQVFDSADIGDFVIRRSDGTPAFFFCNALDDALMRVTLVVRGEDHLTNTPRQILLLEALGLPLPDYAHIALVTGEAGAPLSKRSGSLSVEELRAAGYMPAAIQNYLARLGHTYEDNAFLDLDGLATGFAVERLHKAPARYDEAQLKHWQREALRHCPAESFWGWAGEETGRRVPAEARAAFLDAVRGNVLLPDDVRHWASVLFGDELVLRHELAEVIRTAGAGFFADARATLDESGVDFKQLAEALKAKTGKSGKALFQPLRAALTGELDGPEMAKLLPLMGIARAGTRLARHVK